MATTQTATESKSIWVELMGSQTRLVKGKRYTTRVIEAGTGEPLIFIHGSGGSAEAWSRNVMAVSKDFHVYAIDALYHGYSDKKPLDADDRQAHQVAAVIELMDEEGIEKAILDGESMGAHIIFRLAMEHPERVSKLIFTTGQRINFKRTFAPHLKPIETAGALTQAALDTPNYDTIRARIEWLMASPDHVTDELVEVRLKFYKMPELQAAMRGSIPGMGASGAESPRYEEEDCQRIQVPSLVIWGDFNPTGGPDIGEYFASLIPGAKYHLIKNAGHWPQWEQPQEYNQVLSDFLHGRL